MTRSGPWRWQRSIDCYLAATFSLLDCISIATHIFPFNREQPRPKHPVGSKRGKTAVDGDMNTHAAHICRTSLSNLPTATPKKGAGLVA